MAGGDRMRQLAELARTIGVVGTIALVIVLASSAQAQAQNRDYSTVEWNTAVEAGKVVEGQSVSVEGRRAYTADRTVFLQRALGGFRLSPQVLDSSAKGSRIRLRGKVVSARVGRQGPVVRVEELQILPTEVAEFYTRRRALKLPTADDWKTLAAWARDRGEFFKDADLLDLAEDAIRKAIEVDRKAIPEKDGDALFRLADEAGRLGASAAYQNELRHDGWARRWKAARSEGSAEQERFAASFAAEHPEALSPLAEPIDELFKRYLYQPVSVHASANPDERMKLARAVYVDVVFAALKQRVEPGAANGFVIAAEIDSRLPEHRLEAEALRDQALATRAAEVEKLTRSEVLALAADYRNREQLPQAQGVIESWLSLRRKRLAAEDTEGLLQLADDYRTLLSRSEFADRMLIEAWTRSQNADIAEALEKLGYRKKENRWLTKAEYDQRPEGRLERSLREGRIEAGMSAAQVRKALGLPLNRTRIASSSQVVEVWEYGSAGTKFVVQLSRRKQQDDFVVTAVGQ